MNFKTAKLLSLFLRQTKKDNGKSNSQIRIIVLSIFPKTDAGLDTYYNNLQAYLLAPATQTRLHIDALKYGVFAGLMGGPRIPTGTPPNTNSTPGTWNYSFPMATNKATTNSVFVESKDSLKISIKEAIYNMFGDIPDNALNTTDIATTHIVPKRNHAHAVAEPPEITIGVTINLNPLGGGKMDAHFLTPTGDIAMPFPGVNIQVAYSLIPINATPAVPSPATSADCDVHDVISEAHHIFAFGEEAIGKKLVMFARYVYIKHPLKSGGYGSSTPKTIA